MTDTTFRMSLDGDASALAVILGTNEIASAVAVQLARRCHQVILCHDPFPPVIRRGMAFHDALFEDRIEADGISGVCAETAAEISSIMSIPGRVAVTPLPHVELITMRECKNIGLLSIFAASPRPPLISVQTLNPGSIATSPLKRIRPNQALSLKAERPRRLTASRAISAKRGESASFIHGLTDRGARRSTSARGCAMESCSDTTPALPSSLRWTAFSAGSPATEHSCRKASSFLKSICAAKRLHGRVPPPEPAPSRKRAWRRSTVAHRRRERSARRRSRET